MPAVAVMVEALRGNLPGLSATIGVVVVIIGVAIVNHPRADAPTRQPDEAPSVSANEPGHGAAQFAD